MSTTDEASPACVPAKWPLCVMVALVLLRLATGWHFFSEGTKKIVTNPATGQWRVEVPTEMLFSRAVGPLEDFFQSKLPSTHNSQQLLAQPHEFKPPTDEELEEAAAWEREYEEKQKIAVKKKEPIEIEFPPNAPYRAWAVQIVDDWREVQGKVVAVSGLSEEAQKEAAARFQHRHQQLADYLASESDAISEWRHELWRLENWKDSPGANEIPFVEKQIDEKQAETTSASRPWIAQVESIQDDLYDDWRALPPPEDRVEKPELFDEIESAVADSKTTSLDRMNLAVTCLIIGVGVLLMLGLFTRVAAIGGCIFLLMVMSTQPPWVAEASKQFFYYQLVEMAALGVLFATCAGRFAGLDFFLSRCCGKKSKA
ncbi:DoxX family protein [Adhaeretor mobilis]|uniref:DoxX family protein n=1 Tax=Adhaeretor mobilis TaxID=1930276 RepID=UPI001C54E946|nr:DoxX family protein [Adhaeretor mobilis]